MALVYTVSGACFAVREVREEVLERIGKGPWVTLTRHGSEVELADGSVVNVNPKHITAVADTGHIDTQHRARS